MTLQCLGEQQWQEIFEELAKIGFSAAKAAKKRMETNNENQVNNTIRKKQEMKQDGTGLELDQQCIKITFHLPQSFMANNMQEFSEFFAQLQKNFL